MGCDYSQVTKMERGTCRPLQSAELSNFLNNILDIIDTPRLHFSGRDHYNSLPCPISSPSPRSPLFARQQRLSERRIANPRQVWSVCSVWRAESCSIFGASPRGQYSHLLVLLSLALAAHCQRFPLWDR